MSNIKTPLVVNEVYHISSRAVGDTVIFDSEEDFFRGIFSIYEFNNRDPVNIWERRREREVEKRKIGKTALTLQKRNMLVEVLAFSFMPNHFHLLLKQLVDNGITEFMRKVNGGYAKYFNKKYNRKGHLFNLFKPVLIKDETQFKNAFTYVHTNLISIIEPGWKENGIKNSEKVKKFLEKNKRHSYPDYLGKKNFPSVTERNFILEIMGGPKGCKAHVDNWITLKNKFSDVRRR